MYKTHNCKLYKLALQKNILKAYKHTWEAGTDVHEGVMLRLEVSPHVTQNEDNGQAIRFCWKKILRITIKKFRYC